MYLDSRNALNYTESHQVDLRLQALWTKSECSVSSPIEKQQIYQLCKNSKKEDLMIKESSLNPNPTVPEPVRIFLERLHPQRKSIHCSNTYFLNEKSINGSTSNTGGVNPIGEATKPTLNHSSTDEILMARDASEVLLTNKTQHIKEEANLCPK